MPGTAPDVPDGMGLENGQPRVGAMGQSKVKPLTDGLAALVRDGDTVFLGGFGQGIPFAAGHELIRQGRRGLTLCRSGADILFDQLIAAGCTTRVVFGYIGNPGIGLAHAFRRAVAEGSIEVEEWSNFAMVLRLHASALGVPFLPSRVLRTGDIAPAVAGVGEIDCPFTGESLSAIPALTPDVALVHAQRADELGNVQLWGIAGDTVIGALASRRILVTVEEVVERDLVREDPNRTVIPGYRVQAVCPVPWGAHPSYVQGYYARDDAFYHAYDEISRTPERLKEYLDDWVFGVSDRAEYARRLDTASLEVSGAAAPPVTYGFDRR